jgi:drug/metabolite transporter (DMT)-like permease
MSTVTANPARSPSRLTLAVAFAAIYLIWGSTYLAIRIAIEDIPPLLMAALRYLAAGILLGVWAWQDLRALRARDVVMALITGGLLFLGGNGGVSWAEQRVDSGPTALMIALVPLWITVFEAARPGGERPNARGVLGIALGLVGLILLVGPRQFAGSRRLDPVGAAALVMSSVTWAAGSIVTRQTSIHSRTLASALPMFTGGLWLLAVGLVLGEGPRLHLESVSARSWLALAYLIVFGAIIGFSAYSWLLRVTTPARAATYAYVNPVVAVLLGWAFGGEPISARTIVASIVIVTAVVLVTGARSSAPHRASSRA